MVAIDASLFDRSVHSLDLTMGTGMFDLCQSVLDAAFSANTLEDMFERIAILCPVGKSLTDFRLFHMATVFGLIPSCPANALRRS